MPAITFQDDDSRFRERHALTIVVVLLVIAAGAIFASTAVSCFARIASALP